MKMFLANYSDGLSDAPLPEMIEFFRQTGKIACFLAIRHNFGYHIVDFTEDGRVRAFRTSCDSRPGSTAATSFSVRASSSSCAQARSW